MRIRRGRAPFWDLGGNVGVVRTLSGELIFLDTRDESVGAALRRNGEWEPHIAATMQRFLRPGQTAIEVGSNIGTHVVTLSRSVGISGSVFAIEPNPNVADLLRATIGANHLRNVILIEKAVLDRRKDVELWASPTNLGGGAVALPAWQNDPNLGTWLHHPVEAWTLDDLFSAVSSVDLVHIDAEGCELAVLAGGKSLLARSPNVCIIAEWGAHHAPSYYDVGAGLDLIAEQNFRVWRIEPDGRLIPQNKEQLLARNFCDVLMTRRDIPL